MAAGRAGRVAKNARCQFQSLVAEELKKQGFFNQQSTQQNRAKEYPLRSARPPKTGGQFYSSRMLVQSLTASVTATLGSSLSCQGEGTGGNALFNFITSNIESTAKNANAT